MTTIIVGGSKPDIRVLDLGLYRNVTVSPKRKVFTRAFLLTSTCGDAKLVVSKDWGVACPGAGSKMEIGKVKSGSKTKREKTKMDAQTEINETEVTENQNPETAETENSEINENPEGASDNSETGDGEEESAPALPMPKTFEEFKALIPKTASNANAATVLIVENMFSTSELVKEAQAVLSANKKDLSNEEIIQNASSRTDPDIIKAYTRVENARRAYETAVDALVSRMKPILDATRLSEEAVAETDNKRRENMQLIGHYKEAIKGLGFTIDPDEKEFFLNFVNNFQIPGARGGKTASVTTGDSEGYGKPRLYQGKIHIEKDGKRHEEATFPNAANYLSKVTNSPVTREDVVRQWCLSQNVETWKDIPFGVTRFQFQDGIWVEVEKNPDPAKKTAAA